MTPEELLSSLGYMAVAQDLSLVVAIVSAALTVVLAILIVDPPFTRNYPDPISRAKYKLAAICAITLVAALGWLLLGPDPRSYVDQHAPPALRKRLNDWEDMARITNPNDHYSSWYKRYIFVITNYKNGELEPIMWRKEDWKESK